jgi:hypothetical protein
VSQKVQISLNGVENCGDGIVAVDHRAGDPNDARAVWVCGPSCLRDAAAETKPSQRREWQEAGADRGEPIFILGLGHQWSVQRGADGHCGVCGNRKLSAALLCPWCLRSSVDALLPRVPESEKPRPIPVPRRDGLAGGEGETEPAKKPPQPRPKIKGGWRLKRRR